MAMHSFFSITNAVTDECIFTILENIFKIKLNVIVISAFLLNHLVISAFWYVWIFLI